MKSKIGCMIVQINKEIKLVPISLNYLEDIFTSFDVDVIKYLPMKTPPLKIEETKNFIQDAQKKFLDRSDFIWVILKNSSFIGCCGIRDIKTKAGNFGYWIKKEEQGKGYGKAVAIKIFQWCFENLDIDYIKYPVDKRNIKSIKIIESLGGSIYDQYQMGEDDCLDVLEYRIKKAKSLTK